MHTLALTEKGAVFSCGNNAYNQCVDRVHPVSSLTRVKIEDEIVDIACGDSHSLCLTDKGKLYVFGENSYQQLGMDQLTSSTVVKCKFFWDNGMILVNIYAGGWHNICMDDKGYCWGFGWTEFGQLGVDKDYLLPTKMIIRDEECKIDQISLGPWHSLFLTVDNEIYTCGYNASGECSVLEKRDELYDIYHLKRNEIGLNENCRITGVIAGFQSTWIVVEG